MKINFYKVRKNNRYNYTPRYYKGKDTGNIYDFDSKFQKYKDATNAIDFGSQWAEARKMSRTRGNRGINRTVLYIILILVLLCLWILDFDLSIFTIPR
ncbi:hypothetical protein [Christiangramia fulva]|uniref:hypothetical protein n=1 Tax=Christiangramia fulva TaxID=2126553 RepID=UPI0018749DA7|nr:hypothetical protein [Christiangramia fulva]